jgi:Tol biopolymer transport system component
MPDERNRVVGDDGELNDLESWHVEKTKRSAGVWHRLTRSPLMAVAALFQTACLSMVCLVGVLIAAGVINIEALRCKLSNNCVTPDPEGTASLRFSTTAPLVDTADAPCEPGVLQNRASKVSFVSDRQDEYGAVYLIDIEKPQSSCRFLTNSQGIYSVGWANDRRVAFGSSKGLWVSNVESGGPERITDFPISEGSVDWSPDGKRLVFAVAQGPYMGISVMDADGTNRRVLTADPAQNRFPKWSPDGKQIVFTSDLTGNDEIYIIKNENTWRITDTRTNEEHPAWSPDGTQIAFDSDREGNRDIYVMNVDGSNVRRLTRDSGRDEQPAWSTDGKQIVFVSYRAGNNEIYVMKTDGSNQRRLTFNLADDSMPAWVR